MEEQPVKSLLSSSQQAPLQEDTTLLRNILETATGQRLVEKIFNDLKPMMLNVNPGWQLRIVRAPAVGRSIPRQGLIVIDFRLSEADATQQLVQELWNMLMAPVFGRIESDVRELDLSQQDRAMHIEYVEWSGIPTVMEIWQQAKAKDLAWTRGVTPRWEAEPTFLEHFGKVDSSVYKQ
jgi:hypothetical protein